MCTARSERLFSLKAPTGPKHNEIAGFGCALQGTDLFGATVRGFPRRRILNEDKERHRMRLVGRLKRDKEKARRAGGVLKLII